MIDVESYPGTNSLVMMIQKTKQLSVSKTFLKKCLHNFQSGIAFLVIDINNKCVLMADVDNIEQPQSDVGISVKEQDASLEVVYGVPLQISAVLGKAQLKISELVKLARGSVVELDRKVGEAVEVFVNDKMIAKGEIVLIDNKIGITITELVKKKSDGGIG